MGSFARVWYASLCTALIVASCSKSNNVILGRVEAMVGSHVVIVTDCYRTSVPKPERLSDSAGTHVTYRFAPCRDAEVLLHDENLTVNDKSYGHLARGDTILIDHGRVLINDHEARIVFGQ